MFPGQFLRSNHQPFDDLFSLFKFLSFKLPNQMRVSVVVQWKGEVAEGLVGFKPAEIEHVGQELSDVLLYLLRLSEKCHIDLPVAAKKKMALNAKKYPSEKVKGSSKKYNEY